MKCEGMLKNISVKLIRIAALSAEVVISGIAFFSLFNEVWELRLLHLNTKWINGKRIKGEITPCGP